jgi:hypothetical protein
MGHAKKKKFLILTVSLKMERVAEWWETIFPGDVGGCCDGRDGIPVSIFILSHLSQ